MNPCWVLIRILLLCEDTMTTGILIEDIYLMLTYTVQRFSPQSSWWETYQHVGRFEAQEGA